MSIEILSSEEHTFNPAERSELFEIMRDAYARTEVEIWGENYLRMPQAEYEGLIDEGRILGAILDGRVVGSIFSKNIDSDTSTFGLLAVHRDFGGRGIGSALVEAAEQRAQLEGSKYMNIEILRPRDFEVPIKNRLRSWYAGMDYEFTHHENFQDRRPDRAKDLKEPSVFDCYRKVFRKLYCLSGLGVDHRAFENLQPKGVEMVHIPWIDPLKKESLADYAKRLFDSVSIPEEYSLIGVSFGGMIAQEFEKIRKPQSLILVSTISNTSELPWFFKLGGRLRIHRVIPQPVLNRANWFTNYLFGVKSKEDKQLLKEILHDSDIPFFRWAMGAIVNWYNSSSSEGIRIHGGNDKILPQKGLPNYSIPKAGHFMVVTHGKELTKLLNSQL